MEAQLENPTLGTYHGYPMPENDPLANDIRSRWDSNHVQVSSIRDLLHLRGSELSRQRESFELGWAI